MKKIFLFLFVAFVSTSISAQEKVSQKQKKEVKKLLETNRAWARAASPEQFFSFIGGDAFLLAPDKKVLQGHEEFGGFLGEMQSLPGFSIKWEPQSGFVSKDGELGYTIDRILVNFNNEKGEQVSLYEKGVTIWKKDDNGDWKLAVDIWNVDPTITSIYK